MATNFNDVFKMPTSTASNNAQQQGANKQDKPKSQFWLNLGYAVEYQDAQGEDQERFVSLPMGIALDTMDKVATNSSNQEYAALQSARNNLLEQLMEKAQTLNPGESTEVNLTIQLRRVNDEQAEISAESNPFVKALNL